MTTYGRVLVCFRGIAVVLECPMDIYRFVSDSTPSVSAFTSDRTGNRHRVHV
jgi:hypothetical protein